MQNLLTAMRELETTLSRSYTSARFLEVALQNDGTLVAAFDLQDDFQMGLPNEQRVQVGYFHTFEISPEGRPIQPFLTREQREFRVLAKQLSFLRDTTAYESAMVKSFLADLIADATPLFKLIENRT